MAKRGGTQRVNTTPDAADARTLSARARLDGDKAKAMAAVLKGRRVEDGWQNVLTGIGDPKRDKRMASGVFVDRLTYDEAAALYRTDDMVAKIVDRPAKEMVRRGFEVHVENKGELDEETGDAIEATLFQSLDWRTRSYDAERYSRAYGGAGIFIGAVDLASGPDQPLNEDNLQEIRFLTVLDRRELYPLSYYTDPTAPKFGMPEFYRVQPAFTSLATGTSRERQRTAQMQRTLPVVHESRILRFEGVVVNRWQQRETLGWGDSVIQRIMDVVRDFQMSWHSAAYLITDFSQAVATMKGISEAIESGDDKSVQARLLAIEMMRSVARMVVMDEGETFERKATPLSGLKELLDGFFTRLASAAEIPVTLLAGEAPAGLNATGASDIRNWYDQISSMQTWRHEPLIRRLVTLLCKSKRGPTKGQLPEKIQITFNPLWQLTSLEEAQRRKAVADTDHVYIMDQVLDPAEVAIARFGGPAYSSEITIDIDARRDFLAANPPGAEREEPPDPNAPPGAGGAKPGEKPEPGNGSGKEPPEVDDEAEDDDAKEAPAAAGGKK
jgi:phage-related protein (TIGR01555 family)